MGYELQEPEPDQSLPAMNPGIAECCKVTESGVWYHPPGALDDDLRSAIWICSPLEVTAVTRNAEGENWGRLVEFADPEGRKHAWAMPMRLLQADGREYRAVLADMGLNIASSRKAREL
jgi:putative DNA primase/helicase